MKKQLIILSSILLLAACTSEKEPVVIRTESSKVITNDVKANRSLTMEIEGMTCVMGCGASIRKELFATKAVSSVEFDFVEERKVNTAEIAFDKDKITVDKIVQLVSELNEKQFKVGKTSSKEYTCTVNNSNCSSDARCSDEKECKIKSASKIEIPNFLDLLSGLFVS